MLKYEWYEYYIQRFEYSDIGPLSTSWYWLKFWSSEHLIGMAHNGFTHGWVLMVSLKFQRSKLYDEKVWMNEQDGEFKDLMVNKWATKNTEVDLGHEKNPVE